MNLCEKDLCSLIEKDRCGCVTYCVIDHWERATYIFWKETCAKHREESRAVSD